MSFQVDTALGNAHIRFIYTQTDRWSGEKTEMDYRVELGAVPCHYGGVRYWFVCPLSRNGIYCGRRIGTVYIAGKYFGCRKCYRLLYDSQLKSRCGGRVGAARAYLDMTWGFEEREAKLRVKYWKGRPTKRYERYLRRVEASRGRVTWIAAMLGATRP